METLIPVIVGGIIGVLGGLVGPPLTHWLSQGADKKRKRAEKLEELICVLYDHEHWLSTVRSIRAFGGEEKEPPSPLPKARAISAVYLPEIGLGLAELTVLANTYEKWMLDAAGKRLAGKMGDVPAGFKEAYEPYLRKLNEIVRRVQECAEAN